MSCSPWPESISFFKCSGKSNMNYQTNNLPYIIHFLFAGKILEVCWTNDTFRHLAKLARGSVKWASYVEPTGMNSLPVNIWGTKLRRGKQKLSLFSRLFLLPEAIHCSPVGASSCVGPVASRGTGFELSPYLVPTHTAPPREDPAVWEGEFKFPFLAPSSDVRRKAIGRATPPASGPRCSSGFTSASFLEDISFWLCVCMCFPYNFQC